MKNALKIMMPIIMILLPIGLSFCMYTNTKLIYQTEQLPGFDSTNSWDVDNFDVSIDSNASDAYDDGASLTVEETKTITQPEWTELSTVDQVTASGSFDYLTHKKPWHCNTETLYKVDQDSNNVLKWSCNVRYMQKKWMTHQFSSIEITLTASFDPSINNLLTLNLSSNVETSSQRTFNLCHTHCAIDKIIFA